MQPSPIQITIGLDQLDRCLVALTRTAPLIVALIKAPSTAAVDSQRLYLLHEDTDHDAIIARQACVAALLALLDALRPHIPASAAAHIDAQVQATMLDKPH